MTSFKYICFVQNLRFKAANDKCNINNIIIISSAVSQTGIFARSLGILCIFFYWTSFFMFIIKHTSYITYAQKLSKWLGMLYILDIQIFQYCAKIIELWNFLPAIPPIKIIKKESKFCITQYITQHIISTLQNIYLVLLKHLDLCVHISCAPSIPRQKCKASGKLDNNQDLALPPMQYAVNNFAIL